MSARVLALAWAFAVVPASPAALAAQGDPAPGTVVVDTLEPRRPKRPVAIYQATAPLAVTLTANLERLRRDDEDKAPWRAATLTVVGDAGDTARIPLRARTRGKWRLENCAFPPVRLNFWKDSTRDTPFERLDEPKLVNYCREGDRGEEYVLRELQLYRAYALLTPYSHATRLLRMTYADSASGRVRATRWAFLLEEPDALADRLGLRLFEFQGMNASSLDARQHVLYAVFQYMIGNVDWSIYALHNAELYEPVGGGRFLPVAYDFDFSGAVDAPYATPPAQLRMRNVRERRYRGYCVGDEHFAPVFALFNERKEAIYALYRDEIGRLLPEGTVKRTLDYFDDFYRIINDPDAAQRLIVRQCQGG